MFPLIYEKSLCCGVSMMQYRRSMPSIKAQVFFFLLTCTYSTEEKKEGDNGGVTHTFRSLLNSPPNKIGSDAIDISSHLVPQSREIALETGRAS